MNNVKTLNKDIYQLISNENELENNSFCNVQFSIHNLLHFIKNSAKDEEDIFLFQLEEGLLNLHSRISSNNLYKEHQNFLETMLSSPIIAGSINQIEDKLELMLLSNNLEIYSKISVLKLIL